MNAGLKAWSVLAIAVVAWFLLATAPTTEQKLERQIEAGKAEQRQIDADIARDLSTCHQLQIVAGRETGAQCLESIRQLTELARTDRARLADQIEADERALRAHQATINGRSAGQSGSAGPVR